VLLVKSYESMRNRARGELWKMIDGSRRVPWLRSTTSEMSANAVLQHQHTPLPLAMWLKEVGHEYDIQALVIHLCISSNTVIQYDTIQYVMLE